MTFTHALSRRLGLLRDAATVAALVVVASCDLFSPVDSGLDVAQLIVMPGSATLPTSSTQAFAAYGRLKGGDSVAVTVTWSATGGSISSAGIYTAGPTPGAYAVTATGRGFTATATVTLTSIPVASVSVSPASVTLAPDATQQLSAVTRDSAGNTLTGRVVTWASSNSTVATVSGSGLVTAVAAGSATISATSEGKNGTSAITVQASAPGSRAGHYVAPTGSRTGDGSATRPWDLATALAQPTAVQPGDTIWLRGGTYDADPAINSSLTGTAGAPIIVRQYPGERAIIDGYLTIQGGGYTWYWGFEVTNSVLAPPNIAGIGTFAPNTKLINLVVHDAGGNGIGFWATAPNSEMYGCIIYNNGRQVVIPGHAHGTYTQNQTGTKLISDNFFFHNLGFDIHAYSTNGYVNGFTFRGNVGINPGQAGAGSWVVRTSNPMSDITFEENMVYSDAQTGWAEIGESGLQSPGPMRVINNYIRASVTKIHSWDAVTVTGNTFATDALYLTVTGGFPGSPAYVWNNNAYYGTTLRAPPNQFHAWIDLTRALDAASFSTWQTTTGYDLNSTTQNSVSGKPTTNRVFVRPNQYEAKRANIIVYNWQALGSVSVDVSTILASGDRYEVRNVQNWFGPPTVSGTYGGGSISIPMTGVTPPTPIGGWPAGTPRVTGPEFNAFVLLRTSP